ncbi:hypothetical protein [Turicimonas sp. TL08]
METVQLALIKMLVFPSGQERLTGQTAMPAHYASDQLPRNMYSSFCDDEA